MEEEYKTSASPLPVSLKWGLIGGILYILILGWQSYRDIQRLDAGEITADPLVIVLGLLQLAVVIFLLIMVQREHRETDLGGYMSYGRALGVATLTGIAAGLLVAVFTYVLYAYIKPELIEFKLQVAIEQMSDFISEERLDELADHRTTPFQESMGSIFSVIFLYFFVGLFTSIGTKRSEPELS